MKSIIANYQGKITNTNVEVKAKAFAAWHNNVNAYVFHGSEIIGDENNPERNFITEKQVEESGNLFKTAKIKFSSSRGKNRTEI